MAEEAGIEARWRPVLLGGVLKEMGVKSSLSQASDTKTRHTHMDIRRCAALAGQTVHIPDEHPRRTVDAMRLLVAVADGGGDVRPLAGALYDAYWVENRDVADRKVLRDLAAPFGVDAEEVLARPGVKQRLFDVGREASDKGVFGVPTFVVDGDIHWGADRMHFVRDALQLPPEIEDLGPGLSEEVEFFHDFSSPYSYLASTQIARVAAEAGARVRSTPILLGALFRDLGGADVPMFTYSRARQAWTGRDLQRWADSWGVGFSFPSVFPLRTVTALRVALVEPAVTPAIYEAAWAQGRDISNEDVLRAVCTEAGHDGERLLVASKRPTAKSALRDNTARAKELGVYGVPTFRMGDGALIWGQDRLTHVARFLRGWRPGTTESRDDA